MENQGEQQLEIFPLKRLPSCARRLSWAERFVIFDQLNPWVYEEIKQRAFEWVRLGDEKIGMRAIIEDIRWHVRRTTQGRERFRINNCFAPYYADKLISEFPHIFGSRIETRARRTH